MSDQPIQWRNRIVKHDEADPRSFLKHPRNFRIHSAQQENALEGVLDTVGWVDEVKVNIHTNTVVDGHLRVKKAIERGQATIPVTYVDLTEEEELIILATFDQITGMARIDDEALQAVMDDIAARGDAVDAVITDVLDSIDFGALGNDIAEHWRGMPAFEQEQIQDNKIIVHFADDYGRQRLAELLGQTINPETKYIWFPKGSKPKFFGQDINSRKVINES